MCSYNLVNGDHSCENSYLLNDVLKKDWGFKGWVVSDWWGTHSTVRRRSPASIRRCRAIHPNGPFFGDATEKGRGER